MSNCEYIKGLQDALGAVDAELSTAEGDAAKSALWGAKTAICQKMNEAYTKKVQQDSRPVVKPGRAKQEGGDAERN